VKYFVRKPTKRNVEILMILDQMKMESLRSDAHAVTFVLRAMNSRNQQRLDFDETNLPMFNDSPLYLLTDLRVTRRIEGLHPLGACKLGDDTQQEFVDFAKPFRTSPESCVKTFIKFVQYHRSKNDVTEVTITQLTAVESVAEHFAMLKWLSNGGFADPRYPALSFN
jgi:hypothetical protein